MLCRSLLPSLPRRPHLFPAFLHVALPANQSAVVPGLGLSCQTYPPPAKGDLVVGHSAFVPQPAFNRTPKLRQSPSPSGETLCFVVTADSTIPRGTRPLNCGVFGVIFAPGLGKGGVLPGSFLEGRSALTGGILASEEAAAGKRQKLMTSAVEGEGAGVGLKKIGTHNGTFHCDEALGCFMLRRTSKFKDAEIVRTRKQEVLDALDVVLDVGGVYDPDKFRFDHHQREFDHTFGHGFTTKLSSAGLVYKHFGRELVAEYMELPPDHKDVETVYLAVYKNFMEAVDAVDNGINQFISESPPLYQNNTHLGSRVARLNPDWLDDTSEAAQNAHFLKAVELTGAEFLEALHYISKSWLPARSIVEQCLEDAKKLSPTAEILLLPRFCPWKQHLADLEQDLKIPLDKLPKYVLYEDDRSGQWRVQAVAVSPGSFQSRLPLPDAWRGLRDEELSATAGIPGCVFVHSSGFIGGNATKEGTLEMAKKALSLRCTLSV